MYMPFSPSCFCPHQFSPSYGYPLTIWKFMSSPCVIYASLPSFPQEDTRRAISSKGGVTCPKTTCWDAIRCWKKPTSHGSSMKISLLYSLGVLSCLKTFFTTEILSPANVMRAINITQILRDTKAMYYS